MSAEETMYRETETATLDKLRNEFDTNYPCQDRLDAAGALVETIETFCQCSLPDHNPTCYCEATHD